MPEYINKEVWNDFIAMRKEIKKPMTERAQRMALKMLEKMHYQGHDVNMVLEQSIFHCWQSLYPVKAEFQALMGESEDSAMVIRLKDRGWAG